MGVFKTSERVHTASGVVPFLLLLMMLLTTVSGYVEFESCFGGSNLHGNLLIKAHKRINQDEGRVVSHTDDCFIVGRMLAGGGSVAALAATAAPQCSQCRNLE